MARYKMAVVLQSLRAFLQCDEDYNGQSKTNQLQDLRHGGPSDVSVLSATRAKPPSRLAITRLTN